MGQYYLTLRLVNMKVFLAISSLVAAATAAPQVLVGGHGIAHAVAPVVHAAPLVHHAPVVAHAAVEAYPDEVSPYTYNYAVADDYSNSNFNAAESNDGTGVVQGSYQVNLPDGRTQTVNYHANDIDGYVAEVTYDGQAVYPEAVPVAHAVAHPVAVAHAAPVVHAVAHPVAHAVAAPVVAHAVAAPVVAHTVG